nr:MAG TPA: hypothetical protein [Caudoviricetes sp.]
MVKSSRLLAAHGTEMSGGWEVTRSGLGKWSAAGRFGLSSLPFRLMWYLLYGYSYMSLSMLIDRIFINIV